MTPLPRDPRADFTSLLRQLASWLPPEQGTLKALSDHRPGLLQEYLAGHRMPSWKTVDLLLTDYEWHFGDSAPWCHRLRELYDQAMQNEAGARAAASDVPAGAGAWHPSLADSGELKQPAPSRPASSDPLSPQAPAGGTRIGRRASAALAALAFGAAAPVVPAVTLPLQEPRPPATPEPLPHLAESARHTARRLQALREGGRSGEAYALLAAAAAALPDSLVAFVAALEESGQYAEIASLLWEIASLPPSEQARTAVALKAWGRAAQAEHALRLAAGLPPASVAELAGELLASGHADLGTELLKAVLTTRQRADSVAVVHAGPALTDHMIAAAREVSADCHRSLLFMLRRNGG
ncbi:hypothetical protein B6E66_36750 [Streptomyces maremycinicus]|nr:hypothetical protein B6E66_36750 [Streptomyces sp. B9173]